MSSLSAISTSIGSTLIAASLLTPLPAEAQRSRPGFSGSSISSPRSLTSSGPSMLPAVGILFLMATSSGSTEDQKRAFEVQLEKIIADPSPANIAGLKQEYAIHVTPCLTEIGTEKKLEPDSTVTPVEDFQTCLKAKAAEENRKAYNALKIKWASATSAEANDHKTSTFNLNNMRHSTDGSYASALPICQQKFSVQAGDKTITLATAEKVLDCLALENKKESDRMFGYALALIAAGTVVSMGLTYRKSRQPS